MTTDRETLRLVGEWLEEGRTRLPDHVLDSVLAELPSRPQRRASWLARRTPTLPTLAKISIAAVAVVAVAIVGLTVLRSAAPSDVGGSPPSAPAAPSATPSQDAPPEAPTSGVIDAGRYRWSAPGGEVSFDLPDGWTGTPWGVVRNLDTPVHLGLAHYLPGSADEVTHVYADACRSEGRLEPVVGSELPAALEDQAGTEAGTSWYGGFGDAGDPPTGLMVEIGEEPGLDRSTCRHGSDGPLQIWADPQETTFFALRPGYRGLVFVFDRDGAMFVFTADLGPEATEADADAIGAIVATFEFTTR